jgi:aconitate decarboxylase
MALLHAPLDALFEIAQQRKLLPNEITSVVVDLPDAAYHHGWWKLERPVTPVAAQMNVAYALAVAILDGAAMVHQFSPQRFAADDVWQLVPKITARHDLDMDKAGPKAMGSARVTVEFTDGSKLDSFRKAARTASEPMTTDEVSGKFSALVDDVIAPDRRDATVECVLSMESLGDISSLGDLLAPQVRAVFH